MVGKQRCGLVNASIIGIRVIFTRREKNAMIAYASRSPVKLARFGFKWNANFYSHCVVKGDAQPSFLFENHNVPPIRQAFTGECVGSWLFILSSVFLLSEIANPVSLNICDQSNLIKNWLNDLLALEQAYNLTIFPNQNCPKIEFFEMTHSKN